ncbi:hypothetical protein [Nitrospina gracilis]|uniref:hypothetical protein n=1 Tax=Nitrospina gracilis TaxID=35801 RepID=UPI001F249CA9|nr:hypothetical protein [Nitrospina gracilis]MCF8719398.1 hypothetical protein [Nitrospina gracilis Nb-211]
MTWPQDAPPPPATSRFHARDFFNSFLYGLFTFMGIAAIVGAVIAVFLFYVMEKMP